MGGQGLILEAPDLQAFKPRTIEGAWTYWRDFLSRNGKRAPHRDDRTVPAYVSENRWCADCPACDAGIFCWSENPDACCLRCGSVFRVEWPAEKAAAEKVLEDRPPANRHWQPHRGETVEKLERENELMRNIEARPVLKPVEPTRSVFQVKSVDEGGLDNEALTVAKTGYIIRYDRNAHTAEFEVLGKSDVELRAIRNALKI